MSFKPENFIPGIVIGFVLGLLWDLAKPIVANAKKKTSFMPKKRLASSNTDEELKLVYLLFLGIQL